MKIKKNKTFVIAEIGINHSGKFDLCKKMIDHAYKSGADAVKIQTISVDESYLNDTASYKAFKGKDFSFEELKELKKFSNKLGLIFFTTPGDIKSLSKVIKLKVPFIKISSGLNTNLPLIKEASRKKIPILFSTGMANEKEISTCLNLIKKNKNKCIGILKCTSLYPPKDNQLNLNAIKILKKKFKVPIGFSDHTKDDLAVCTAVSLGAEIIEKHFTLNKKLKGADHNISLEPFEFLTMVKKIRRIEQFFGQSDLSPVPQELDNRKNIRRYIFTKKKILSEQVIKEKDICFMRSNIKKNNLFLASEYKRVIGKKIKIDLNKKQPIEKKILY